MQTHQIPTKLFDQMTEKFGGHAAAAAAVGVPRRTYLDWRRRGFKTEVRRDQVQLLLQMKVAEDSAPSMAS